MSPEPTRRAAVRLRCAAHPARPAVDRCRVCGRLRCGADARYAPGGGCRVCLGVAGGAVSAPGPGDLERLVRACLAASAVGLLGAPVAAEYVGAEVFSVLVPVVLGVLCGAVAVRAAGTDGRGRFGAGVRAAGAGYAVLGVALGYLVEGSRSPVAGGLDVLVGYAAAVAGCVLWTLPPRRLRTAGAAS